MSWALFSGTPATLKFGSLGGWHSGSAPARRQERAMTKMPQVGHSTEALWMSGQRLLATRNSSCSLSVWDLSIDKPISRTRWTNRRDGNRYFYSGLISSVPAQGRFPGLITRNLYIAAYSTKNTNKLNTAVSNKEKSKQCSEDEKCFWYKKDINWPSSQTSA